MTARATTRSPTLTAAQSRRRPAGWSRPAPPAGPRGADGRAGRRGYQPEGRRLGGGRHRWRSSAGRPGCEARPAVSRTRAARRPGPRPIRVCAGRLMDRPELGLAQRERALELAGLSEELARSATSSAIRTSSAATACDGGATLSSPAKPSGSCQDWRTVPIRVYFGPAGARSPANRSPVSSPHSPWYRSTQPSRRR